MAAGGHFARLEPFDKDNMLWTNYFEVAEQYFLANDIITPNKQTAVLLSSVGTATYADLKDAVAPQQPKDMSVADINETLTKVYEPPSTTILERFRFLSISQKSGQTITQFVSALRKQASKSKFGAFMDDALRDIFVYGLRDQAIQKRLLGIEVLNFEKAQKIAISMETATKGADELQASAGAARKPADVHAMKVKKDYVVTCFCCGQAGHLKSSCKYKDCKCHTCDKVGHISPACPDKAKKKPANKNKSRKKPKQTIKYVSADVEADSSEDDVTFDLFKLGQCKEDPLMLNVRLNGEPLSMELDTGSGRSIISEKTYRSLWPTGARPKIQPSRVQLKTYTGECVKPVGEITVDVDCGKEDPARLPLVVAPGDGPALLGRSWLPHVPVNWPYANCGVHALSSEQADFADLFRDELGTLKGVKVHLDIERDSRPRFHEPRSLPFALREKVNAELDRMEAAGVISPVKTSKWAAPLVPVIKPSGQVRLCGDYKITINPVLVQEKYPLPTPEDLFSNLAGGVVFSKLDLSHAYNQLELDEPSRKLLTVNTLRGLYTYNRLPFGVSSAVSIFQREMETLLRGIAGVAVYLDDILITGQSEKEHDVNLQAVLSKLSSAGLRLKKDKCVFRVPSVSYLGYQVSAAGLQPLDDRVRAIVSRPAPTDIAELQSFIGLITYYDKFLPKLSTILEPLHCLLRKGQPWVWGRDQENALKRVKDMLQSAPVLAHYDARKPLVLTVDSSAFGVGAVLSHVDEQGNEHPIAYKSRKLSSAQKNYSQLDKEALAILYGVHRFHKYLFGREFVIYTDHKPLLGLLGEQKPIPPVSSARLQRWAITLSAYNYTLRFKPGMSIAHADALSRLPYSDAPVEEEMSYVFAMFDDLPVSVTQIRAKTERCVTLSKVKQYLREGWPSKCPSDDLLPFFRRQLELSLDVGVIMWGSRVVVPEPLRRNILTELHGSHPGRSRMKALARSFVWWPNMDSDIDRVSESCSACQEHSQMPAKALLQPTVFPQRPWYRLHMDFAGPVDGHMLLIIVDAYSKWVDVHVMTDITAERTVTKCRQTFSTHGVPVVVVTDNGASFCSHEFTSFMRSNGVKLRHSSAYHPASNGLAENAVKSVKASLKKMTGVGIEDKLSRYLFSQRITPHTTTGRSPAELLMGRLPRSRLSLLRPDVVRDVQGRQEAQKAQHDRSARPRSFEVDQRVLVRNLLHKKPPWFHGTVTSVVAPLTYEVRLDSGKVLKRHIDHIRKDCTRVNTSCDDGSGDDFGGVDFDPVDPLPCDLPVVHPGDSSVDPPDPPAVLPTSPELRRSNRSTRGRPPEKMDL